MRILITGHKGQLGQALERTLTAHAVSGVDLPDVDITDYDALLAAVKEASPEVVIHSAAYTDVEGCARDPALAYRVNALGARHVALACRDVGADMVHVSTNEVLGGDNPAGYDEWAPLNPGNPYAASKAAAERYVRALLPTAYIVRIAWAFGPGGRNFVHSILRYARERGALQVVADEIGSPTYMEDAAKAIARLIPTGQYGVYHFVNSESCSRWAFANEILRLAELEHVVNQPILGFEYRRASAPPRFGVLHNTAGAALGITLRPWHEALADFMSTYEV